MVDPAGRGASILALVPDAYGGFGGIAQSTRDFLDAVASHPEVGLVTVLPRHLAFTPSDVPSNVRVSTHSARGKLWYGGGVIRYALTSTRVDAVLCGHINLLPLACFLGRIHSAPVMLTVHGIEAWQPHPRLVTRFALERVQVCAAVSRLTLERLLAWTPLRRSQTFLLPNTVHLDRFYPGPRNGLLARRFRLDGRTVIMTLGRLATDERYKGFDEVLDVLPDLIESRPDIVYVIAGDGSDRDRLQEKSRALGVSDHVRFTGSVPEEDKVDLLRLADAFVMPSTGEGFGIVLLEALACGIPVVGSTQDGTREALLGGRLGELVEPTDPGGLLAAISRALDQTDRHVPPEMAELASDQHRARAHAIISHLLRSY